MIFNACVHLGLLAAIGAVASDTLQFSQRDLLIVNDCVRFSGAPIADELKIRLVRTDTTQVIVDQIKWKRGGRVRCYYAPSSGERVDVITEK